jgi:metal-responsive CopG/Arc/MetJ family transcriptional regulator
MTKWTGVSVRMTEAKVKAFEDRCKLYDKSRSEMLKEMVNAFLEGRLKINLKNSTKEANEELYQ